MHCLRRASSRLLQSPFSNHAAISRSKLALPIQSTASLPVLLSTPYHHALQTRWNSSEIGCSTPRNKYARDPVEPTLDSPEDGSPSKREMRHRILDSAKLPPCETVYVGNIFYDLTAEDLRSKMEQFGIVTRAIIVYDNRGLSKGFGYVEFASVEDAANAIEKQHMQVMEGRETVVQYARGFIERKKTEHKPTNTLFIGGIPFELTDRDLQDLFADIKNLVDVRVPVDRRTGMPRGFAHAEFLNTEFASRAMEILRLKRPYGRKLKVHFTDSRKIDMDRRSREKQAQRANAEAQQAEQTEQIEQAE